MPSRTDWAGHDIDVGETQAICRELGHCLSFDRATVTYLGRVVGQGCVALVQAKVMAVEHFPRPF